MRAVRRTSGPYTRAASAASAACLLLLCSHAAAQTPTSAPTTTPAPNATAPNATAPNATTPGALAMPWLPSTAVFSATSCSAAEVEAAAQCQTREAAAFTGQDACVALELVARCWPRCFCVHSLGYQLLAGSLRAVCVSLPICGPREPVLTQAPATPSSHARRAALPAAGLLSTCAWALAPLATAALTS